MCVTNSVLFMANAGDSWYPALLGLADSFRQANNIKVRKCVRLSLLILLPKESVRCLSAVFNFNPPALICARTHLQLGSILHTKTNNQDLARHHLYQAWSLSQNLQGGEEIRLEAASTLAKILVMSGDPTGGRDILLSALDSSQAMSYWHCRLTFQLASLHISVLDYNSAHSVLQTGADYAFLHQAYYTRSLFLLSKIMLFLCEKRFQEANPLLQQISPEIESWAASYEVSLSRYEGMMTTVTVLSPSWGALLPANRRSTSKCSTWSSKFATI